MVHAVFECPFTISIYLHRLTLSDDKVGRFQFYDLKWRFELVGEEERNCSAIMPISLQVNHLKEEA